MKTIFHAFFTIGLFLQSYSLFAQLYAPEVKIQNTNGMLGIGRIPSETLDVNGSIKINVNERETNWANIPYSTTPRSDLGPYPMKLRNGQLIYYKYKPAYGLVSVFGDQTFIWDQDAFGSSYQPVFLKVYGIGFYTTQRLNQGVSDGTAAYISANYGIDFFVRGQLAMRIDHENQAVGIGVADPDFNDRAIKLDVGGKIKVNGTVINSDRELKQDIQDYHQGLNMIKKVNVVKYKLKSEIADIENYNKDKKDKKQASPYIGLIAQELQQIAPDLVHSHINDQGEETLSYDFTSFTFLLVNAIK